MIPGDTREFYRWRRMLLVLGCAAPLLLAIAAWWAVDRYVLTIPSPTESSSAEDTFRYVVNAGGLAKRPRGEREKFFDWHLQRCRDAAFAQAFSSAYRSATQAERELVITLLWDTFLPRVQQEARRYFELSGKPQAEYLDDCIVRYNQLGAALRATKFAKPESGGADELSLFMKLVNRVSEEEQALLTRFMERWQARVLEILANPELKRQFEERISAATPPGG